MDVGFFLYKDNILFQQTCEETDANNTGNVAYFNKARSCSVLLIFPATFFLYTKT